MHVESLLSLLTQYEKKRIRENVDKLIDANQALTGNNLGFYYAGERFYDSRAPYLAGNSFPDIHPSLERQAEILFEDKQKLEQDSHKIKQSLTVVFRKCRSQQDVRDVLPDTVVNALSLFRGMKRTRPEGFILEDGSYLKKQYERAMQIAEYYIINRLIY